MPRRFDTTDPELDHLLRWVQDGVVSRPQLLALGATDADVERMLRRRELTRVHPGVYVNHTGALSSKQREWVAVLAAWPAALTHESALPIPRPTGIHLAVHHGRKVAVPPFVLLHRTADLDSRLAPGSRPPRLRIEHELIDAMSRRVDDSDTAGAFALLAQVLHTRQTGPDRVLAALAGRQRVGGRPLIEGMLCDARDGVCSVLERGYVVRVERPHGLPRGDRQVRSRATGESTVQDVRYRQYGVVVELDGKGFHDNPRAWDTDATRDLAELASTDAVTARVTYGMVYRDQCRTAHWIGQLLRRRRWDGPFVRCPLCP